MPDPLRSPRPEALAATPAETPAATLTHNLSALALSQPALAWRLRELPAESPNALAFGRPSPPIAPPVPGDAVVLGLGRGHAVRALAEALPDDAMLLIIERRLAVVRAALALGDWRPLLGRPGVRLICEATPGALGQAVFEALEVALPIGVAVLRQPVPAADAHYYEDAARTVAQAYRRYAVNLSTAARYGRRFAYNLLRNAPDRECAGSLAGLAGAYADTPVICVAAGPSLQDSLVELRRAREGALLIACDAAVTPLLAAGIVPDVVTAIDLHGRKARIFRQSASALVDTPAVFASYVNPRIARAHHGPRAYLGTRAPIGEWLNAWLPADLVVPEMLSVAHASFYLARFLDGDPIVLVGHDLAFTRGAQTHAAGAIGTWGGDANDRAERLPGLLVVPGTRGRSWPTLPVMAAFVATFAGAIASTASRVLNATARGADIPGAPWRPLRDLAQGWRPLSLGRRRRLAAQLADGTERPSEGAPDAASRQFASLTDRLSRLRKAALAGQVIAAALDRLASRGSPVTVCDLEPLESARRAVAVAFAGEGEALGMALQPELGRLLDLRALDRRLGATRGAARLAALAERCRRYHGTVAEGAAWLAGVSTRIARRCGTRTSTP